MQLNILNNHKENIIKFKRMIAYEAKTIENMKKIIYLFSVFLDINKKKGNSKRMKKMKKSSLGGRNKFRARVHARQKKTKHRI